MVKGVQLTFAGTGRFYALCTCFLMPRIREDTQSVPADVPKFVSVEGFLAISRKHTLRGLATSFTYLP